MRSATGWWMAVCLVVGCTVSPDRVKTCGSDTDCGAEGRCDVSAGLCYARGTEPESDSCSPACAAYEACTTAGCQPRFTALNILSPGPDALLGRGPVQVVAELVVNPTYAATTQLPDTLLFNAARSGGGDTGSFGTVSRSGQTYTTTWTPPAEVAQYTLTTSHPTPAAAQSSAVNVRVDPLPPSLTLRLSSPPVRAAGSATLADQRDPEPGYEAAFRRDESVSVTVSADEPVKNVSLTVVGIGPGGAAGQTQPPVAVEPGGTCAGSPAFCGSVTVDLSVPEMRAFRGTLGLRADGQDAAGNPGTASAEVKVTRWKWAFTAANIPSTPAIGNSGMVYLNTDSRLFAIAPDGAKKWDVDTSYQWSSPAVGASTSNDENVYVRGSNYLSGGYSLDARSGKDGTLTQACPSDPSNGTLGVGSTVFGSESFETGLGLCLGGCFAGVRPGVVSSSADRCAGPYGTPIPSSAVGGSVVIKGSVAFYGTTNSSVTSYDANIPSTSPRAGWPQSTGQVTRGLAMVGSSLYGAAGSDSNSSLGGLFKLPAAGGSVLLVYPAAASSRVFNLAVGSGNIAYFGAESGTSAELLALALDTPSATPLRVSNVGTLRGAPVVGRNDRVYTLNTQGRVAAWKASTLAPQWDVDLSLSLGTVDVSPTLDCRRDASGLILTDRAVGTLYIGGGSRLYAFIVDSPGLDPNAPWPKYQHDARNTGNPDLPITLCQ